MAVMMSLRREMSVEWTVDWIVFLTLQAVTTGQIATSFTVDIHGPFSLSPPPEHMPSEIKSISLDK